MSGPWWGPLVVLWPAMLAEGPVATLVGGSLAGAGVLAWWLVWAAALSADLLADSALHLLGRCGNGPRTARLLRRLGLTPARWESLRTAVGTQLPRVVIGAKLVDASAVPAFLATGMAGVPYRRVMAWNVPVSALRTALLTGIGAVAGQGLADAVLASPWLALACGLTLGLVLLALQAVVGRVAARRVVEVPR